MFVSVFSQRRGGERREGLQNTLSYGRPQMETSSILENKSIFREVVKYVTLLL